MRAWERFETRALAACAADQHARERLCLAPLPVGDYHLHGVESWLGRNDGLRRRVVDDHPQATPLPISSTLGNRTLFGSALSTRRRRHRGRLGRGDVRSAAEGSTACWEGAAPEAGGVPPRRRRGGAPA